MACPFGTESDAVASKYYLSMGCTSTLFRKVLATFLELTILECQKMMLREISRSFYQILVICTTKPLHISSMMLY